MTETQIIQWIKTNLGPIIDYSLVMARGRNPDLLYTEDWLGGIAMRETGGLIAKLLPSVPATGNALNLISPLMRGDFGQRPADKEKMYHGFGFWQIDIASFPAFIKSGDWKDALFTCEKAIAVLEDKRAYIHEHFPQLAGDDLARAITAAYNCGEGNVVKVLTEQHDIDIRTTDKNYSAEVWRFRGIYQSL